MGKACAPSSKHLLRPSLAGMVGVRRSFRQAVSGLWKPTISSPSVAALNLRERPLFLGGFRLRFAFCFGASHLSPGASGSAPVVLGHNLIAPSAKLSAACEHPAHPCDYPIVGFGE